MRNTIFLDISLVTFVLCSALNMAESVSVDMTNELKTTNRTPLMYFYNQRTDIIHTTTSKDRLQHVTLNEPTKHRLNSDITHGTSINVLTPQNELEGLNSSAENPPMRISDLRTCMLNPPVRKFSIKGSTGHLHVHSPDEDCYWRCKFLLRVQSYHVVRFQINSCRGNIHFLISDHFSVIKRNKEISRCLNSELFPVQYSMTDTVMVEMYIHPYERMLWNCFGFCMDRLANVSMSFSAVNRSERSHLELQRFDLSSFTGYIQTPGLDGSTPCPTIIQSCLTLTRPPDHVIFLSTITWQTNTQDSFTTYFGRCGSRHNLLSQPKEHSSPLFLFPDHFGSGTSSEPHMSIVFYRAYSTHGVYYKPACIRLKFRFSFHADRLKPRRVPGLGLWNCTVSVWPDLYEHFPCDLSPQCAEHEDEAPCPYTSDTCGLGKIDAGETCYIFNDSRGHPMSHADAQTECQNRGASLVSLETAQEVDTFGQLMKYNTDVRVWVGAAVAEFSGAKSHLSSMYANTLLWKSGAVVHFLSKRHGQKADDKCVRFSNTFRLSGCNSSKGFVCEVPLLSGHLHVSEPVTLPVPVNTTSSGVPLEICPMQHVTHQLLACEVKSRCRELENTETWYRATCSMSQGLSQPYFYCDLSGEFVPYSLVCDFRKDCLGGRDEDFCQHLACEGDMIDCRNGQCVGVDKQCDGFDDCMTSYDEKDCEFRGYIFHDIPPPAVIHYDVPGGFTITPLPQNNTQCPDSHFQCHDDGYCLPVHVRCNGMSDCPDHEDEADCHNVKTCPGFYRCRDSPKTVCVHVNHLCDGLPQCPLHDDELMCDFVCPESCVCYGFAFSCSHTFLISSFLQLRYLAAAGSGIRISDVTLNVMLIHLGVQACGWRGLTEVALPNLHALDLSQNLLHSVNFSHFAGMPQLRELNLAANPLLGGILHVQEQYIHPSLAFFNISHVQANYLSVSALSTLAPALKVLDLSWNKIEVLQEQFLFDDLQVLNLQGCPITDFSPDFMKDMTNLVSVFADNFKLCCSVVLPDNFRGECWAPSDEISSCDDLLKSVAYRCALAMFAVLAVLGNVGGFVYRVHFWSQNKTGFVIFVLHLSASDFLMGVYLLFIGMADWVYAGSYLWNEAAWKKSSACCIAGFLSLLSCEVSAFLICFITLDRFLVLRFPFSHIRFGVRSAHIACVIMWALGLSLAAVPLLPVTSHWEFFQQTGICIPLPVTRADFPGHVYAFSLMVICNLVLFLMIGVGQCLIYWSVRSNAMSNQLAKMTDSSTESTLSKEATIAQRLFSIAVSDFLCWFPIGLCGVLAALGVVIPGEVNIGMAIFVLPLNSALNPFLYTLNVILEKRRKAQELRFQKLLRAYQKK